MKAHMPHSSRSDKILVEHLKDVENIPYEDAEVVICVGDRVEIHQIALKAFISHKYLIHYYAGVKQKYNTTYDDYLRHCITIMSNEQWVESKRCKRVVKRLCRAIGKKANIKIIGSNHMPTELDYSKIPNEPYNLVLYNPCTTIKEVFIHPNPDVQYGTLPQEVLLGLVEKCNKLYTNSSMGIYEAPFLIKKNKIIWLGKRNKMRKL